MKTFFVLLSVLTLVPTWTPAGPSYIRRLLPQNHRAGFVPGGYYYLNGVNCAFVPLAFPYGGFGFSRDIVYQGRDISDDIYPYAQPTSNPNIVISPFAPNALIDVNGIPPGARVRDPVSEQIFLRP